MSDTENNNQVRKQSDMKAYIVYGIIIVALSYAFTYGMRIWDHNKRFKNVETALNVPVTQQQWQSDSSLTQTDMGTFNISLPTDDIQFMAIIPQQGSILLPLKSVVLHINQPTSAKIATETIEKAQKDNPDNQALKNMAVNSHSWHVEAAKVTKIGYFDFVKLDEVARNRYLAMVNYKSLLASNASGIVIFETDKIHGILHRGSEPAADSKESSAIVQLWDKNRDIIQDIRISFNFENIDDALEYVKPILASINYDEKEVAGLVEQVEKCGKVISQYPWFKLIRLEMSQGPQDNPDKTALPDTPSVEGGELE